MTTMARPACSAARMALSSRAMFEAKVVRATLPGCRAISSTRLSRTSASEPEVPGLSTLVLSPIIASTPPLPKASRPSISVLSPTIGAGSSFQSPVCITLP